MANNVFRPPKPRELSDNNETITTFASWKSNILYHLSLNNEFASFLESEWGKSSVANRGLVADGDDIAQNERKTAAQKKIHLERMLGLIAQFSPSLLRNDIIDKSTSLSWIWKRIRKHYSFQQSEVNFLRLSTIRREPEERFETLYQRIVAHLEDNKLTTDSNILHDGAAVTVNEELSPTCERLAVYLWLNLVDQRLPAHVSRVYAHDLQRSSLKDLQPQICDAMDSLLAEINTQEDINVNYSRTFSGSRRSNSTQYRSDRQPLPPAPSRPQSLQRNQQIATPKECIVCKAANRSHLGHTISTCWHISKADRMSMAKALQVSVDYDDSCHEDEDLHTNEDAMQCVVTPSASSSQTVVITEQVRRVKTSSSPYFFAFYQHHTLKVLVDTGATSTVVSYSFVRRVGIKLLPTKHTARQLDQSTIPVIGEVKFTISFGKLELLVEGIVNNSIDCDILAGIPFCKANDVDVLCRRELISIGNEGGNPILVKYGSEPDSVQHDIYRVETTVLRNDSAKVVYPGEFLELDGEDIQRYEGEISVEPRANSPLDGLWPQCAITRVIQGKVRVPNDTKEPIHVGKSMHLAQIRRVVSPTEATDTHYQPGPIRPPVSKPYTSTIQIDPSGKLLTESERRMFSELHLGYDNQFKPDISVYNGYSGNIKAYIDMGPIPPPAIKPKMPLYNQTNMRALQDEADGLEAIGVLGKPEVLGVKVRHSSPSFLTRKPDGTFRMVTAFNQLGQYVRYPPSVSITCDDALRKLACWKYIVKTDMKQAYYQIPMAKTSMQWLGTHTPFGGLRVYTRPVMGMPGSAEFLQELLSRVFGDLTREGFVIIIADDLNVGGNTIDELFIHWKVVLHYCQLNNLTLSPTKTIVCPESTLVLGWVWRSGTIAVSSHKLSPLATVDFPATCSAMRSFIGAYKALSRCIPRYS